MSVSLLGTADRGVRRAVPALSTLLITMFAAVPTQVGWAGLLLAALPLVALIFWISVRPDLMSPWLVLAIGLLHDLAQGERLGAWGLTALVAMMLVEAGRRAGGDIEDGHIGATTAFAAAGSLAFFWLWNSLLTLTLLPPWPAVWLLAATLVFYPPLGWLLGRLGRAFLQNV